MLSYKFTVLLRLLGVNSISAYSAYLYKMMGLACLLADGTHHYN